VKYVNKYISNAAVMKYVCYVPATRHCQCTLNLHKVKVCTFSVNIILYFLS